MGKEKVRAKSSEARDSPVKTTSHKGCQLWAPLGPLLPAGFLLALFFSFTSMPHVLSICDYLTSYSIKPAVLCFCGLSPVTQMHKAISISNIQAISSWCQIWLCHLVGNTRTTSLPSISPGLVSSEHITLTFQKTSTVYPFCNGENYCTRCRQIDIWALLFAIFPSERNQLSVHEYCLVILLWTNESPSPSNDRTFALGVIQHLERGNLNRRTI